MTSTGTAVVLSLALALSGQAASRTSGPAPPAVESSESDRLHQQGLDLYARGERAAALAVFREGLRRDPANRTLLAAVRRIESELSTPSPSARRAGVDPPGVLERVLLVKIPRWYHFERTIGDRLSGVGTLNALNARIVQLLGERRLALARNRPFRNDRQLRELIRRAPLAARDRHDV